MRKRHEEEALVRLQRQRRRHSPCKTKAPSQTKTEARTLRSAEIYFSVGTAAPGSYRDKKNKPQMLKYVTETENRQGWAGINGTHETWIWMEDDRRSIREKKQPVGAVRGTDDL